MGGTVKDSKRLAPTALVGRTAEVLLLTVTAALGTSTVACPELSADSRDFEVSAYATSDRDRTEVAPAATGSRGISRECADGSDNSSHDPDQTRRYGADADRCMLGRCRGYVAPAASRESRPSRTVRGPPGSPGTQHQLQRPATSTARISLAYHYDRTSRRRRDLTPVLNSSSRARTTSAPARESRRRNR